MSVEQLNNKPDSKGCKTLLVIDSFIADQVKKRSRNIALAWIDYPKVFDLVPHHWLLEVLKIYKLD